MTYQDDPNITKRIHPAGFPFIASAAGATIIFSFFSGGMSFIFLCMTVFCAWFFRDPLRQIPNHQSLVLSPADGKVVAIVDEVPAQDLGLGSDKRTRVSIFLNVFDVHVNRMPIAGIVRKTTYRAGKFLNASLDKASVDNERMAVVLEMKGNHRYDGQMLGVVQIAGLIARRIVCNATVGQKFEAGEHFGIIRFGSRTDIWLPLGLQPLVKIGDRATGGETIIANCE